MSILYKDENWNSKLAHNHLLIKYLKYIVLAHLQYTYI